MGGSFTEGTVVFVREYLGEFAEKQRGVSCWGHNNICVGGNEQTYSDGADFNTKVDSHSVLCIKLIFKMFVLVRVDDANFVCQNCLFYNDIIIIK